MSGQVKFQRAREHSDELKRAVKAFFDSEPFIVETRESPAGDLDYFVRVRREVPETLGAIVGDLAHNLRSALDHLAWDLVLQDGGKPGPATYFPIGKDEKAFRSQMGSLQVSKTTREKIGAHNPYAGGNDPLWWNHHLDRVDKHRHPLLVGAAYRSFSFTMPSLSGDPELKAPPIALRPADRLFPLADGAQVFRVNKEARAAAGSSEMEYTFNFEIGFGDPEVIRGEPLLETVHAMEKAVETVLSDFGAI